jgi:O-antigen/teichoic acid export membrane protein
MNNGAETKELREPLSLKRLLAFGRSRTGVLAITTGGTFVVRTISSVILTRLLTPYDFGIIGIIGAIFFAVTMVTDLGFEAFLIRHERAEDRHFRDVLWTIHVKRGVALFILLALGSPLIAWLLDKPVIALPMAVASTIFFLNGPTSLSLIMALRHDKAREVSLLDFGLQLFQTATCLLLALWWRNVWALIGAMMLQTALRTLLSFQLFPNAAQRLKRDRAISQEFLAFSRIILMSSALTLLIAQTDKLVLGRLFTLSEFGLYTIAITIASAPAGFCESYGRRIAMPVYARAWREKSSSLGATYYGVRRRAAALYAFACGGLIGSAPLVIALLYDPRYTSAAIFVSLLMVATALHFPNVTASEFLTAVGDMGRMLRINVVRFAWLVFTIPAGFLLYGTLGVVGAVGLVELPAMLYCWKLLHRMGVLDLREEFAFLGLVAVGAAIGWLGGAEVLLFFPHL